MIYKIQDKLKFGADVALLDKIPLGNWLLIQDELTKEFYLQKQNDFILPNKIYGNEVEMAERYLNTFLKQNRNMAVLLAGDKGNGKSLTAKLICQTSQLPVILITKAFTGELFQAFLASLKQPVVVYIDEFEKVYPDEENKQEEFLPILDGVFQSNKLFIFTSNSMKINEFLKNRPNRIRYLRKYRGLEKEVVSEIIEDRLKDKKHLQELNNLVDLLSNISMDVLLNIIEEVNMYDEPPFEAVRKMNVQVEHSEFDVLMFIDGKRRTSKIYYNPLTVKNLYLHYKDVNDRGREKWEYYEGTTEDMNIQASNGEFIFTDNNGNKFIFTASKPFEFSI